MWNQVFFEKSTFSYTAKVMKILRAFQNDVF